MYNFVGNSIELGSIFMEMNENRLDFLQWIFDRLSFCHEITVANWVFVQMSATSFNEE